jgi:hypothetical protein
MVVEDLVSMRFAARDLDLLDLLHDLGLAEVERHRAGGAGVHQDGLHLLVVAERLDLHRAEPTGTPASTKLPFAVRHRPELGAEENDVRELDRDFALLGDRAGHAARGAWAYADAAIERHSAQHAMASRNSAVAASRCSNLCEDSRDRHAIRNLATTSIRPATSRSVTGGSNTGVERIVAGSRLAVRNAALGSQSTK